MTTNRLEAFSDGVLAIVITIMVLELNTPDEPKLSALWDATGVGFLTYVLSFVYIGIYWNNHHHTFQLIDRVTGPVLWANLHLLFWLSLYPLTTRWLDESNLARTPTVVYGLNLFLAGLAYYILGHTLRRLPEAGGERYRAAVGVDPKGVLSQALYLLGVGLAFVEPWLALVPYVAVAVMWLVPDRRIERFLERERTPA